MVIQVDRVHLRCMSEMNGIGSLFILAKEWCLIGNYEGFTLVEVVFAFSFFILISATVLPIVTYIYKERVTLEEKRDVLFTLEEEVRSFIVGNDNEGTENVTRTEINENVMQFCLQWLGSNGREYEHCLLAAK